MLGGNSKAVYCLFFSRRDSISKKVVGQIIRLFFHLVRFKAANHKQDRGKPKKYVNILVVGGNGERLTRIYNAGSLVLA